MNRLGREMTVEERARAIVEEEKLKADAQRARREMEIMGHEIEAHAAAVVYARALAAHREREIRAMRAGYDGLFADIQAADLRLAMKSVSTEAARWVRRNRNAIERWK